MGQFQYLTINGQTYTVADPDAACIRDDAVGADAWSSKKLLDTLGTAFTETGAQVACQPVPGYPLTVVTQISPSLEGRTGAVLQRSNESQTDTFTADFGQTVYGGSLDWSTGVLTCTWDCIDSYAGEEVGDGWLSSTGELTQGAQVVYPLTQSRTVTLTAVQVPALAGINTLSSDTGDTTVSGVRLSTGGSTPVKGVDYFTQADKQELVAAVIAALPEAEEVAF